MFLKIILFSLLTFYNIQAIAQYYNDEKANNKTQINANVKPTHNNGALFFINNKKHLPLLSFEKYSNHVFVRDTFYLMNRSDVTIKLKTPNIGKVSTKDSIKPCEVIPVFFEENYVSISYEPVVKNEYNIVIQYNDTLSAIAFLQYDVVNRKAEKKLNRDGSYSYFYKQTADNLFEIQTTKNNYLKAFGRITMNDSTPVGVWKIMDSVSGKYLDKQLAKLFIMRIPDNVPMLECTVVIKQTDSTEIVFKPKQGKYIPITISEKTKQVEIIYDSAIASYPINFDEQLQEEYMFMQLLKPNDQYFYYGKQKLLLNYHPTKYHIAYILNEKDSAKEEVYLDDLQKKFSRLHIYKKSQNWAFNIIDLFQYTTTDREEIIQYILEDKNLKFLTKLSDKYPAFYLENVFEYYGRYEQKHALLYDSAQKLGFIDQSYNHQTIRFVYKHKLLNEKFIQQYNKLVQLFNYYRFNLKMPNQIVEKAISYK